MSVSPFNILLTSDKEHETNHFYTLLGLSFAPLGESGGRSFDFVRFAEFRLCFCLLSLCSITGYRIVE